MEDDINTLKFPVSGLKTSRKVQGNTMECVFTSQEQST